MLTGIFLGLSIFFFIFGIEIIHEGQRSEGDGYWHISAFLILSALGIFCMGAFFDTLFSILGGK